MPFTTKKIRIEDQVAGTAKGIRTFKLYLALSKLRYINPIIGRGILGKRIEELTRRMIDKITMKRKLNKIGTTKYGRAYINHTLITSLKRHVGEKKKIKTIKAELKNLYKNKKIKGTDYIEHARAIIFKHLDRSTASKIDKELTIHLLTAELGKKGIVDLLDGRTFYSSAKKPVTFQKFKRSNINEALTIAGVRKSKKDYFDFKLAQIMIESIRSSKTPEEATAKFESLYKKALEEDPLFKAAEFNAVTTEFVKMYNLACLVGALHETLTTVPSRLVALASRLVAQAYRMLPIVGAIASAQVEAAGAVAEIGEAISSKVESSAYMYYNLNDVLGDKGLLLSQILSESKENQTAS